MSPEQDTDEQPIERVTCDAETVAAEVREAGLPGEFAQKGWIASPPSWAQENPG